MDDKSVAARVDRAADSLLAGTRRHALTLAGMSVFLVAFVFYLGHHGLLLRTREWFAWTLIGVFLASLGNLRRFARGAVLDWAPLFAILLAYDAIRGRIDEVHPTVHVVPQLPVDQWLGAGSTLGAHLQHVLWNGQPRWWDYAALCVYLTHFFVTLAVAAVLWRRRPELFRRFRTAVIALSLLALVTYAVYPAAPPWWTASHGQSAELTRVIPAILRDLAGASAGSHTELSPSTTGSHVANPVAALPSLHAALPMLMLLFFYPTARRWTRAILAGYVIAMAFTLVYTGEHFVFDILLGWIYAAAVVAMTRSFNRRRAERADRQHLATTIDQQPTPGPATPSGLVASGRTAAR
jgi:hypothetical protein